MALSGVPFALVITNPNIDDNPIVFVNHAFTKLTGYDADVCIGRNCRFLQGKDTDPKAIQQLRDGVSRGEEFMVELLNYKADKTPFLNRVFVSPLYGENGEIQYFIGVQRAVGSRTGSVLDEGGDEALREIHHRVKNHLSMVVGMIRMQARVENADSMENYATLARRIETLQFLYDEMTIGRTVAASDQDISLGAYVSRIASAIAYLDGRESVRLNVDLANVKAPIDAAAQVGLLVSELLTNAYQHAFRGRSEGLVEVRLRELSEQTVRIQVSDDGIGLPPDSHWPDGGGLGGKIVRSLLTGLEARLDVSHSTRGCTFTIDVDGSRFDAASEAPTQGEATAGAISGNGAAMQISHDRL